MAQHEILLEVFDPEVESERLRDWLRKPHVARWWGDCRPILENLKKSSRDTQALILADGAPVGYMCWQSLSQDKLAGVGLTGLPDDLVDIDILIGEASRLGKGIGPAALGALLERLRENCSVSLAGVATSVSNRRAIRAFEKAGFRLYREYQDPEFGPCRYMIADIRGTA